MRSCFQLIKKNYGNKNLLFDTPKIGAGLAGGDWKLILKIINEETENENITLVLYDGG